MLCVILSRELELTGDRAATPVLGLTSESHIIYHNAHTIGGHVGSLDFYHQESVMK